MYTKKRKLKIIKKVYDETKSIGKAARSASVHYYTAKKYILSLYPNLKKDNNIYIKDNISNINTDIQDIKKDIIKVDNTEKVLTTNTNDNPDNVDQDSYYLRKIDITTKKLLKELNNKTDKIVPSKLPLAIGILLDKRHQILTRNIARIQANRAIFNFFISDKNTKDKIAKITDSMGKYIDVSPVK